MKNIIGKLISWFSPKSKTEDTLRDLELRIMGLEQDVHHLKAMLNTDSIALAGMTKHEEHFDTIVSKSVMKWLSNWAEDKFVSNENLDDAVSDSISNGSYVSDEVENVLDNEDWDYRLRDALDWDKVASRVVDKIDWSDVISDNQLVTEDSYDFNSFLTEDDQLSEDEAISRGELGDAVLGELKRDWFPMMILEQVSEAFDKKLLNARQNEEANARNAIDDEIEMKLDTLIREQMKSKFGEEWDTWYNENTRHCVKVILGEFLAAAYEQTKEGNK